MDFKWLLPENIQGIPGLLEIQAERQGKSTALIYVGKAERHINMRLFGKELIDKKVVHYFSKEMSYDFVWEMVLKTADMINFLTGPRQKVALFMPNLPQFVFCYYGTLTAERIVVPIDFSSIATELKSKPTAQIKIKRQIADQFEDSKPSLIFVADFLYPILKQVNLDWDPKIVVVSPADFLPFPFNFLYPIQAKKEGRYTGPFPPEVSKFKKELAMSGEYPKGYSPQHIVQIQYTSGTTGKPKGVMLKSSNLVSNLFQVREHLDDLLREGEVVLGALPFFHTYGLTSAMNMTLLNLGGILIVMPAFDPGLAIWAIEKYKVTILPGVARMYQTIIDKLRTMKEFDLSSLKLCINGAGPISKSTCDDFGEFSPAKIVQGYGQSEASPVISITNPADINKPRGTKGVFIGTALPGTEIKIVGDDNTELPHGQIGMLYVRGPQVMVGYYKEYSESANTLNKGWLKTGDICYTELIGSKVGLYLVDREKDLIKRRGEKVYPSHIETILNNCPVVSEAVVVGVPDIKDGEAPVACVVVKPMAASVSESDQIKFILSYMRKEADILQVPTKVLIFESFNAFKNVTGKILKLDLKEEVLKMLS